MIQEIQIMLGLKLLLCKLISILSSDYSAFSFRHFHDETGQLTKDLHLDAGNQSPYAYLDLLEMFST